MEKEIEEFVTKAAAAFDKIASAPQFVDNRFTPEFKERVYIYPPFTFYLYYNRVFINANHPGINFFLN